MITVFVALLGAALFAWPGRGRTVGVRLVTTGRPGRGRPGRSLRSRGPVGERLRTALSSSIWRPPWLMQGLTVAAGDRGTATVVGNAVEESIHYRVPTDILGIIGIGTLPVAATARAVDVHGVTGEE